MAKKTDSTEKRIHDSKLWSKHWAAQGVAVIHVDKLKIEADKTLEDYKMRVKRVLMRHVGEDEDKKPYIDGIECQWQDVNMEMHYAIFNSKELVPYDIAKQGIGVVEQWYERKYDGITVP